MERCLTDRERKQIQQDRVDIQSQREQLQQLRLLLQTQEWSPAMKEYLVGLKHEVELLLNDITRLHSAADMERASVTASQDLKDRVSDQVRMSEEGMTEREQIQSAAETSQSAGEELLTAKEGIKEADLQRQNKPIQPAQE